MTLIRWRMIFIINLRVGLIAIYLLKRVRRSPRRSAPVDGVGHVTAIEGIAR